MNPKFLSPIARNFVALMLLSLAFSAFGTTYYWDGGTVTVNGASDGGTGSWTVGAAGWEDGASAQNWANGNAAVFGGTAGTVTLGGAVSATGIAISAVDGYTITANTLTLTTSSGIGSSASATINSAIALGANQSWSAASGKILTLGGVVSGTSTLTYGGAGKYVIGGINTDSGNLTIDTATVTANSGATLFCSGLGWSGRTVTLQNGGVLEAYNYANGSGNLWGQCGDGAANITFGTGGGVFKMLGTTMDSTVNKGMTVNASITGYFRVPTGTTATWSGSYGGRDFTVNSGGTLVFDGGGNFTTARYISGAGNVTKNDGGTLTLSSVNSFSGSLTVNGGTLVASASTSSGTSSGTGNNNAITVNSGAALQYTGSRGTGYHTANCAINGGTVTFGAADMSWCSGRTLTFDTAAGTVNGSGQWRRRDSGNKILVNAAASGSTISVSDLNLYDNNPVFDVADGSADADLTISSGITGSAGLVKSGGAGKLVLTGNSTSFGGSTTISAGTLQIGNGGASGSIAGNITDNAALVINRSDTYTVGNGISGSGTVTVAGGTMIYTGTASHSGATTVASGATLAGTGTISASSGTTVQSGGTLAPGGASIGTLTINNLVTLSSGSYYSARINKTGTTLTADKLAGTGSVALDGTLNVTATGDALAHGDTFSLFAKDSYGGPGFATINLPTLPSPLLWDTSNLGVNGTITVYNPNITAVPTFNPPEGNYVGSQNVTIACATPGADIFYTTDGSTPTASSTKYTTPIVVPVPTAAYTIKAMATNSGYLDSPPVAATYNTVVMPTWVVSAGGSWTNNGNWQNAVVGNDADITADFSTVNLTADATVTLDGARTVGGLKFGDTTPDFSWILNTGTAGPLTLDVTSGSPAIQVDNQTATVGAVVAGNDGLTKTGNGTLVLGAANSYTGETTLNAGTLRVANNSALGGASGGLLTMNGGTLAFPTNASSYTIPNPVTVTTGSNATVSATGVYSSSWPNLTLSSAITNNGTLTLQGGPNGSGHDQLQIAGGYVGNAPLISGHVRLLTKACAWNANSSITLSGANDLLELRSTSEVMPSDTTVTVNAGNFMLNGVISTMTQTIKALNGSGGTVSCDWGANTLKIGANDGSGSYSGIVANGSGTAPALSIVKIGTGTQVFSGTNTYTGATTVSNGVLLINGSLGSGSAVTVAGGTLGGSGTINGTVTLNSGGTLAPGASVGTLTINNTLSGSGTLLMELDRNASPNCDKIIGLTSLSASGTLTINNVGPALQGGETFTLFNVTPTGIFAATNLPALGTGLNWWTADNFATLAVNRAPTGAYNVSRAKGISLKIAKTALMAAVSDPDSGDSPSYDGLVSTGTQGATVTEDGAFVYYLPANNSSDTLTFRVKDTRGGAAILNIKITVAPSVGTVAIENSGGGSMAVKFYGIPGLEYVIQRSLDSMATWQDISTNTTPANGLIEFTETPPSSPAFYRTRSN